MRNSVLPFLFLLALTSCRSVSKNDQADQPPRSARLPANSTAVEDPYLIPLPLQRFARDVAAHRFTPIELSKSSLEAIRNKPLVTTHDLMMSGCNYPKGERAILKGMASATTGGTMCSNTVYEMYIEFPDVQTRGCQSVRAKAADVCAGISFSPDKAYVIGAQDTNELPHSKLPKRILWGLAEPVQ